MWQKIVQTYADEIASGKVINNTLTRGDTHVSDVGEKPRDQWNRCPYKTEGETMLIWLYVHSNWPILGIDAAVCI